MPNDNRQIQTSSSYFFSPVNLMMVAMAAFCSYAINGSLPWMIVHAFFGSFYLLYLCGGCGGGFAIPQEKFDHLINGNGAPSVEVAPADNTTQD
jgi:hypothetical protein